jgi:aryl-alcohol dehydrogenase-like predicted oxidoreductase
MQKRAFGKTGLQVSVLGFGGAPIGYLQTDRERAGKMINFLLDSGVNLIDTAASYEGSEEVIGEAISHRRKEFVLVSKCGQRLPDLDGTAWSADIVSRTVDRSLRRLRTDHLDVMLLHSCDLETLKRMEAIGALVAAQKEGKIRFVGYSGDNEAVAWAASRPEIAVVQMSVNICDQANIPLGLPVARENNVGVMAKRPIANAAWKDIKQQPGLYASYAKTYTDRLHAMKLMAADLGFDGPAAQVWPEIALRFTLSQNGVSTAIIGTTNPENAKANIVAAGKGALPSEVVGKIREAFRRAEGTAGTIWSGQT